MEWRIDEMEARLIAEFGYPEAAARVVLEKLPTCAPEIQAAFWAWWRDGTEPSFQVEGYTVQRLQAEHGMNPFAALLTLDWLQREPERAKASLARGHDKVGR